MPTYDYQCDACDHTFELFQSITAAPQKKCPKCGKQKLRRLFGTGGAIMFKGSGFYKTDYRSASYEKAAKSDSGGTSDSSTSKSDTTSKSSESKTGSSDKSSSSEKSKGKNKEK